MAKRLATTVSKVSIRVAAAGFGAVMAGPLGCALGAAFGDVFSGPLGEMVGKIVEEGGKEASKKLLDSSGDTLAEKIQGSGGNLEAAYREALRQSLAAIRTQITGYEDWFEHWERCLKAREMLRLDELRVDRLTLEQMDAVLRRTLVSLDAQGAMLRQKSSSIAPLVEREMPEVLAASLTLRLPGLFDETFQALIFTNEYEPGYRELMLALGRQTASGVAIIEGHTSLLPRIAADVAAIRAATETFERKEQAGLVTPQQIAEKDSVIAWQAQEIYKLRQELLTQTQEPTEILLEKLMRAGDLPGAVRLKLKQVALLESEAAKRPRDYYELGKLHEVQFEWAEALDAYRRAWRLEQSFDYGFQYAYVAQRQNRHKEAITAYEAARLLSEDLQSTALTLNNLAILYRATQRMRYAEMAYDEARAIRRQLAAGNPEAYLPDVAMTLNNLANLYRATQRMRDAEMAYDEALAIRRQLAKENPETHLPDVALTLNNLAIL